MRPPSNRLFEVYTRLDGCKFHGYLGAATTPSMETDKTPFRVFNVKRPSLVRVGDIVKANSSMILLLDHPDDDPKVEKFKAAYISNSYEWLRPIKVLHPVAKVMMFAGQEEMGLLHCNFEVPKEVNFNGMSETAYRFLTGQDVQVGDIVGGKTVKTVRPIFGVTCGYAE